MVLSTNLPADHVFDSDAFVGGGSGDAPPIAASFTEVSAGLGLGGLLGGSGEFHGGGLTFTDLNHDGFADLYLIGPSSRGNRLYANVDDGNGGRTFVRVASDGGSSYFAGNSTGAVAADYDNDGDLDLYLTNFRANNILFKNMWMEDHPSGVGDPLSLRFVNVTASTDPTPTNPIDDVQHGLGRATFQNPNPAFGNDVLDNSLAAAWADVNRDGWIDLYVGSWDGTNGDPTSGEDGQLGERDTLYLNNGDGTFTDVTMGPAGATAATVVRLIDDGSFEAATSNSQTSNSNWVLAVENNSAQFQAAPWAATESSQGVWFQSFQGSTQNPVDAQLSQQVVAPASGDYILHFDAKVEANFTAAQMTVSLSSSGTSGTASVDLKTAAPDNGWNTFTVALTGVTAGDTLSVVAQMVDGVASASNPQSVLMDSFVLYSPQLPPSVGWEQVGGWQDFDGNFNDPLPAEFSGQNALQFADFNNDGWQDLIVATMGGGGVGPNRDMLYLNRGVDGAGTWLGYHLVSYEIGFGGNESSDMGVTVADVDNDGDLDYFSTLLPEAHPLWINNLVDTGSLGFTRTTLINDFSWGANFHDFDNNGRVDLIVGTDVARNKPLPTSYLHLQSWDGEFVERGQAAGFTSPYSIRGVAVADYNRDGWSDVAQWTRPELNSPGIRLYRNNSAAENAEFHFLTLQLAGDPTLPGQFKSTRDAIGARAYVSGDFDGSGNVDADETRIEEVLSGHANASTTSSLALEFGTGRATTVDVRIVWGSGRETRLTGVGADRFLAITEQAASAGTQLGDYNLDGVVDAADYTVYRDALGASVTPGTGADGDGSGTIGPADYELWKSNFGATLVHIGAGAGSATAPLAATGQAADASIAARMITSHDAELRTASDVVAPSLAPQKLAAIDIAISDFTAKFGSDSRIRHSQLVAESPTVGNRHSSRLLLIDALQSQPARRSSTTDQHTTLDQTTADEFDADRQETLSDLAEQVRLERLGRG